MFGDHSGAEALRQMRADKLPPAQKFRLPPIKAVARDAISHHTDGEIRSLEDPAIDELDPHAVHT